MEATELAKNMRIARINVFTLERVQCSTGNEATALGI
jgi:hypothetical protein